MYWRELMLRFDNLSTDDALNAWMRESVKECRSTYPLLLPKFPVAVDIGANVGGFCVYAKNNFQKIYAFEPEAMNYAVLKSVKDQYQLDNVEIFNNAVYGKSNAKLTLRGFDNNHSKEVTCADFEHKKFSDIGQQCETISLADMIEALEIGHIDYLKMDCEGSEYDIFENFEDYHKISIIALEVHGFYGEKRKSDLLKKLSKYYYFADHQAHGARIQPLQDLVKEMPPMDALLNQHIFFLINKKMMD